MPNNTVNNKVGEDYAYQIERQLVRSKQTILTAFAVLEEEITNVGELTYFEAQEKVALQTLIAGAKSSYLNTIGDLPMRTLMSETAEGSE